MATSLTAMAARRAANIARLTSSSSSVVRGSSVIPRRGLAGAADHHGPPKVNIWQDPTSPSKWKEEHAGTYFWPNCIGADFSVDLVCDCLFNGMGFAYLRRVQALCRRQKGQWRGGRRLMESADEGHIVNEMKKRE
ncbi:hypothetical protein PHJA_002250800 [Phtheirospermum japonicum]|uniref:Uncharacterized protein n=1 Tax=Phtheirospermum japonicum TaxID=374723 RepID=A0A830CTU4_9LAMI|nr:hypothetical protein PHJA_002250800 [Phtheirospermum japonicum]